MEKLIINKSRLTGAFYKLAVEFNEYYSKECTGYRASNIQYYAEQAMNHPSDILLFNGNYKELFDNELSDTYKTIISRMFDDLFNGVISVSENYKVMINEDKLIDIFEKIVDKTNKAYSEFVDEDETCYNQIVTICYVSNMFIFDDTFEQVVDDVLDFDISKMLCRTVDKMFKGIIEVIETELYEDTTTK